MSALLEVESLTTSFPAGARRAPVVDAVSFSLQKSEVVALVGESGCGKSQTALSILRLVPKPGRIDGGVVRLAGETISTLSVSEMRQVRGQRISMIFQEPMTSLNPVLKVGDQVSEAILLHERVSRRAARGRVLELFKRVGIPDPAARLETYPHQLSGGLKQRVMIAMALSTRPQVLIADEPTTALDVTIQAQILELLRELSRDYETAILLITHDLGVVNELADRIMVMYAGRIVEQGTRQDVLGRARHPYTLGLLSSMPARARRGERLAEIAGVVPPLATWPPGCRFCTRCPRVLDVCCDVWPEALALEGEHRVHCHAVAKDLGR